MGLGTDLKDEFKKLTKNAKYNEAELFTKLQDSFIELSCKTTTGYNISLIHGDRSKVEFAISNSWISTISCGTRKQCELADMLFLIYDVKKAECRMFFMQNKNDERAKSNRFVTNLIQLDLLSNRSEFTDLHNGRNCAILQRAEVHSITTYGVFYKDDTANGYDMKYYSADLLEPLLSSGRDNERVAVFKGTLGKKRQSRNLKIEDYEGTENLVAFGSAIEEIKIGQPIGKCTIKKLCQKFESLPKELKNLNIPANNFEMDDNFLDTIKSVCCIQVNTSE